MLYRVEALPPFHTPARLVWHRDQGTGEVIGMGVHTETGEGAWLIRWESPPRGSENPSYAEPYKVLGLN